MAQWCASRRLQLNADKTEAIWIASTRGPVWIMWHHVTWRLLSSHGCRDSHTSRRCTESWCLSRLWTVHETTRRESRQHLFLPFMSLYVKRVAVSEKTSPSVWCWRPSCQDWTMLLTVIGAPTNLPMVMMMMTVPQRRRQTATLSYLTFGVLKPKRCNRNLTCSK